MPRAGSRFSALPTRSALASLTSRVHGSRRAVVQRLMQALLVVKRKVELQVPLQLLHALVAVQVDVSYFTVRHKRSTKTLSRHRARPSMLTCTPTVCCPPTP